MSKPSMRKKSKEKGKNLKLAKSSKSTEITILS